jgi:hypothetical protein
MTPNTHININIFFSVLVLKRLRHFNQIPLIQDTKGNTSLQCVLGYKINQRFPAILSVFKLCEPDIKRRILESLLMY